MTKIDGRMATVIESGRRYTTYRDFANKYGYPDAAAEEDGPRDTRKGISDGDKVTLLVGGQHLSGMYKGQTLWIVETVVGDRYIINEDGLEISEKTLESATIDGLLETVANLSVRVAELERRIAPRPVTLSDSDNAALDKVLKNELTRDEIVERAKADVAELLRIGRDDDGRLPKGEFAGAWFDSDFVVNHRKRTVVALVYKLDGLFSYKPYPRRPNGPHSKGIAKCAPGDVFNSHIGRAIALRRALGLEVPAEYLNAPKPGSVRVGDIVNGSETNSYYSPDKKFTITNVCENGTIKYAERPTDWICESQIGHVIDDSREESEVGE